jgi:hypothetical protein
MTWPRDLTARRLPLDDLEGLTRRHHRPRAPTGLRRRARHRWADPRDGCSSSSHMVKPLRRVEWIGGQIPARQRQAGISLQARRISLQSSRGAGETSRRREGVVDGALRARAGQGLGGVGAADVARVLAGRPYCRVNNCGGWLTPRRRSWSCRSRRLIMNGRCLRRPWRGCWTRSRPPPRPRRRRRTAPIGSGSLPGPGAGGSPRCRRPRRAGALPHRGRRRTDRHRQVAVRPRHPHPVGGEHQPGAHRRRPRPTRP